MVIGYDAKWTLDTKGGLGYYGRLAIEALTQYFPHNDYILYTPEVGERTTIINKLLTHSCVHLKTPKDVIFGESWRTGKGVLKDAHRHKVQVFHGLNGQLPDGIAKSEFASVVTIGSLTFKHFKEGYSFLERHKYNSNVKNACKAADRIVVGSEFLKKELIASYGVDASRVRVVYNSCEDAFRDDISENVLNVIRLEHELPDHFILVAGEFDERHNIEVALEALNKLKDDTDLHLVVVGHRNSYWEKMKSYIERHNLKKRVLRISKMHNTDMPMFYRLADVVVCPSRYETSCTSIVRALCSGTPVVAATGSCMEEYGGNAALYFSPDSPDQLADAIRLATGEQREGMISAGYEQAGVITLENMATALNDIYHELKKK